MKVRNTCKSVLLHKQSGTWALPNNTTEQVAAMPQVLPKCGIRVLLQQENVINTMNLAIMTNTHHQLT